MAFYIISLLNLVQGIISCSISALLGVLILIAFYHSIFNCVANYLSLAVVLQLHIWCTHLPILHYNKRTSTQELSFNDGDRIKQIIEELLLQQLYYNYSILLLMACDCTANEKSIVSAVSTISAVSIIPLIVLSPFYGLCY